MTPSDVLSPPRRPLFFPVVIATVFLTIIGMTGGFVLGERHRERLRAEGGGQTSTDNVVQQPTEVQASSDRPLCPKEALDTATSLGFPGDLRRVLKVVTENGTTVWICQDPNGGLYYQSKTGGVDVPLVQKKNGLFLSDVRRGEDRERYVAVATDGNQFVVTPEQVQVRYTDGRNVTYQVATVE